MTAWSITTTGVPCFWARTWSCLVVMNLFFAPGFRRFRVEAQAKTDGSRRPDQPPPGQRGGNTLRLLNGSGLLAAAATVPAGFSTDSYGAFERLTHLFGQGQGIKRFLQEKRSGF